MIKYLSTEKKAQLFNELMTSDAALHYFAAIMSSYLEYICKHWEDYSDATFELELAVGAYNREYIELYKKHQKIMESDEDTPDEVFAQFTAIENKVVKNVFEELLSWFNDTWIRDDIVEVFDDLRFNDA